VKASRSVSCTACPWSVKDVLFTSAACARPSARGSTPTSIPEHDAVAVGLSTAGRGACSAKRHVGSATRPDREPAFRVTLNPWNPRTHRPAHAGRRRPPPSRAAAGRSPLGSDGGGSVRIPAAFWRARRPEALVNGRVAAGRVRPFPAGITSSHVRAAGAHRALLRPRPCST